MALGCDMGPSVVLGGPPFQGPEVGAGSFGSGLGVFGSAHGGPGARRAGLATSAVSAAIAIA